MATLSIKPGDRVCYNAAHLKRVHHDRHAVAFVGTVVDVYDRIPFCDVEAEGSTRTVALSNLALVTKSQGIFDPTF